MRLTVSLSAVVPDGHGLFLKGYMVAVLLTAVMRGPKHTAFV